MKEIKTAIFGTGGYAANYLYAILHPERPDVRLVGAVDPFAEKCDLCPLYASGEELFAHCRPDLVIVATPIHFHAEQAVTAFEHGCHVAVEKPIAPTMQEVRDILKARDKAGKLLSVGYQLCAEPMMRAVKQDIEEGRFGVLLQMRAIVLWPRDAGYYHRGSGWAGKKYDGEGRPIFDNVLSNATAHYLMNMLYLAGSAFTQIQCATFRANPIETFDTAVVKGQTANHAKAEIAVSHAIDPAMAQDPMWEYTFENAVLTFGGRGTTGGSITARFWDGSIVQYEQEHPFLPNFWNMIDAIRGEDTICCTGEIAALHTQAMEDMRSIRPEAAPFPKSWLAQRNGYTYVPGLAEALFDCYEQRKMPVWNLNAETPQEGFQ